MATLTEGTRLATIRSMRPESSLSERSPPRLGLTATGGAPADIAALIDHTLLKPDATRVQIEQLCREAAEFRFATVCVNPTWVSTCIGMLAGTPVLVCSVVGFPLGATTPDVKQFEARRAIFDGAREIDMVINIGALKSGDLRLVERDIDAVVSVCRDAGAVSKVILETALLSDEGALNHWCCFCYELRLHRARGYGALKAILDILALEEPMTLTEISQRLHRTPGSTKDYLSWLEDVDLVTSRQKRYSFTDPLLRLWVRLHCRPVTPSADEIAREVQRYAVARLPQVEPVPALAYAGVDASLDERKSWGIIEID